MRHSVDDPTNAGKFDYDGEFAPESARAAGFETFSVGIYKLLPKSSRKGLKRSAVVARVKGPVGDPKAVFALADELCARLDSGEHLKKKHWAVK